MQSSGNRTDKIVITSENGDTVFDGLVSEIRYEEQLDDYKPIFGALNNVSIVIKENQEFCDKLLSLFNEYFDNEGNKLK